MIIPLIGQIIIYIIMACAAAGVIAALINEVKGTNYQLGNEFMMAFHQMGDVFIPIAGMMAAAPYIAIIVDKLFGRFFELVGADPGMAPGLLIAIDLGGYQLAHKMAQTPESWIMGTFVCYMFGPIISFTIPVAFAMLDKRDHKYFGLGIMAGILSIPFGVFTATTILKYTKTPLRSIVSTDSEADMVLNYDFGLILRNMIPLIVFCIILALFLRFLTDLSVKVFLIFGNALTCTLRIILVASIIEYFTGFFSMIFGGWGFAPIIADEQDPMRALEITGFITIMLAGAFPMVHLIRKYFGNGLKKAGKFAGFSEVGSAALIATAANLLAGLRLIKDMNGVDKVKVIGFSVCCSWLLGDHISFTANFQPNMLAILMIGKIVGGIFGIILASLLSVPVARRFEKRDRELGIIGEDEYQREDQLLPKSKKQLNQDK